MASPPPSPPVMARHPSVCGNHLVTPVPCQRVQALCALESQRASESEAVEALKREEWAAARTVEERLRQWEEAKEEVARKKERIQQLNEDVSGRRRVGGGGGEVVWILGIWGMRAVREGGTPQVGGRLHVVWCAMCRLF